MHLFSESDISEDEVAENKYLRITTADMDTLRVASRIAKSEANANAQRLRQEKRRVRR